MGRIFHRFILSLSTWITLALCQGQGDLGTGIANAILGAIFPDVQSQSQQQNSLLNAPGGGLPQTGNNFLRQGGSPGQQRQARLNSPESSPQATNLISSLFGGSPPSSSQFSGSGIPQPAFTGLTNPDNQNSFLYPTGLRGRTDLPSSYVYPFAKPGSLISSAAGNGDTFALGSNEQLLGNQRSRVQGPPLDPQVLDPKYLFTGTPKPNGPLTLNPSLSPWLTSLFNPLQNLFHNESVENSAIFSKGQSENVGGKDILSEAYKKLGIGPPAPAPVIKDKDNEKSDKEDLAEVYRKLSRLGGGEQFQQQQQQQQQPSERLAIQRPFNSESQLRPLYSRVNSAAGNLPRVQVQPQTDSSGFSQQLDWQTALLNGQQQQPNFGQQPVLLQPQIFNQIFPQQPFGQPGFTGISPEGFPTAVRQSQNLVAPAQSRANNGDFQSDNYGVQCPQCSSIDMSKMSGPWVQIYGNPDAMRTIYTTISTLQGLYGDDTLESGAQSVQPVCVGYQISRPHAILDKTTLQQGLESTVNLYYRDDTPNRQLHEVLGRLKQDPSNQNQMSLKLPGFSVPMCSVKVGPSSSTMYSYVILTETIGTNRCQSYHVLARDSEMFFRDNNRYVAEFLKSEVESGRAKPLSVLPHPELCQLQTFSQISQ